MKKDKLYFLTFLSIAAIFLMKIVLHPKKLKNNNEEVVEVFSFFML